MSDTTDLQERKRALEEQLAALQWDLGGLTYEMAIRDHFRLDVLVRAAAKLQEVDAELAEVERLLRLDGAAAGRRLHLVRRASRARGDVLLAVRHAPDGERGGGDDRRFHHPVTRPSHPAADANR